MNKISYSSGKFSVIFKRNRELIYNTNDNTLKLLDNQLQIVIRTVSFDHSITVSEFQKYIELYAE